MADEIPRNLAELWVLTPSAMSLTSCSRKDDLIKFLFFLLIRILTGRRLTVHNTAVPSYPCPIPANKHTGKYKWDKMVKYQYNVNKDSYTKNCRSVQFGILTSESLWMTGLFFKTYQVYGFVICSMWWCKVKLTRYSSYWVPRYGYMLAHVGATLMTEQRIVKDPTSKWYGLTIT